jgi:hypothetical protein
LPLQHFFTIKISKEGFVSKIITADTHVPNKFFSNFIINFQGGLFEEIQGLDVSILKLPIAKIIFDPLQRNFVYDSIYTNEINDRLKKLYEDYRTLSKKNDSLKLIGALSGKDSVQVPKLVIPQQKVVYFIQVFASGKEGKQKSGLFKGLANVKQLYVNGIYKYYTGEYSSIIEAEKFKESINKEFADAFIIVFADGKEISLKEAAALQNK